MNQTTKVRNISVVAHRGHGKSTLTETLVSNSAGVAGGIYLTDTRQNEDKPDRNGATVKSTAFSTCFVLDQGLDDTNKQTTSQGTGTNEFLINIIDSPGGLDLPAAVTTALRVTDGSIVVVDSIDGIGTQTMTALRIALVERIKPVLVINKNDRAILELQLPKEELYKAFTRIIDSVNATISAYTSYTYDTLGDLQIHPENGSVAFASSLHGWGFTLRQFAARYSKKFGVRQDKLMEKLWGENYFDSKAGQWTNKNTDVEGEPLERAFNVFVLDPIYRLYDATMHFKSKDQVAALLQKLNIQLNPEEKALEGEQLLKVVMHRFLPCRDAVLEMACIHLPSPVTAQSYRVSNLYQGPLNDACADGIRNCDSLAPLMVYVFKIMPMPDKDGFYALGRVFSGTARADQKVRIMGPNYPLNSKDDLGMEFIQKVMLLTDCALESTRGCSAGNIIGLVGIGNCSVKPSVISPRKWLTN